MVKGNNSWTGSSGVFWHSLLAWEWSRAQECLSKELAGPLFSTGPGSDWTLLGEVIEWIKLLSIVFFWGVEIRKVWVGRNDGKTNLLFSFRVARLGSLPCYYGCHGVLFISPHLHGTQMLSCLRSEQRKLASCHFHSRASCLLDILIFSVLIKFERHREKFVSCGSVCLSRIRTGDVCTNDPTSSLEKLMYKLHFPKIKPT